MCNGQLKFHKSTFEQYDPSVWHCEKCGWEFDRVYIDGYMKALKINDTLPHDGLAMEVVCSRCGGKVVEGTQGDRDLIVCESCGR